MKKKLLLTCFLICATAYTHAQFSMGTKAALTFSRINTDSFNELPVDGYQAGVWARIGTGFFLQPELYLSGSGGKFNNSNGTNYNAKINFTALNVPLLFGKSLGGDNLNIHLMAGPVYTYILDKNLSSSANFNQAYPNFGNYKNSILSYQVGGGLDLGHITLDLRYEAGLSNINENYKQRQRIWSLILGYKFF